MKKSFLLENGTPFFALPLCQVSNRQPIFTTIALLLFLFTCSFAFSCDIKLTIRNNSMLLSLSDPSGNAADVYTWTMTGGIDAGGSGGTGAVPVPAEITLINNTYSTFTWKVNGVACFSKKVRVKYVCEVPGFTTVSDQQNCSIQFNPYANPPVVVYHAWNFGDNSGESNVASPLHTFTDPGGFYTATHTTVEWNGLEYTIDRCTVLVNIDCSQILLPPTSGSGEPDAAPSERLKVYPNPANDWVQADASTFAATPVLARFYSVTGVLMTEQQWPEEQPVARFDISTLASGHYIMEIVGGDGGRKVAQIVKE